MTATFDRASFANVFKAVEEAESLPPTIRESMLKLDAASQV